MPKGKNNEKGNVSMKVKELNSIMGGGIILRYKEKFGGKDIDSARITGRDRIAFLNRNVYLVFPTENPKELIVSVY